MKKKMMILLLCLPMFTVARGQTFRFTLEEAIDYALEKNFSQQSLAIDKQIEETVLKQSKLELLPDLKASLSQGYNNGNGVTSSWNGNYDLATSVTLYQGGKNMNTIKLNKLSVEQADSRIAQAQNSLASDIIQAYLEVVMNDELYNYLTVVENTSREQMLQGEVKFKNGNILESDYLLLKAQASTDRFNVLNTQTTRDNAILKLKGLLSIPADQTFEIVTPDAADLIEKDLPSLSEVVSVTFAWLPDLQIAKRELDIASLNIRQAKAGYAPTLSLGASVGTGYLNGTTPYGTQLSDKFNQQVSLALAIPLWSKGKTKSAVKQSEYIFEQSQLSQADTELQLRQQLEQEYNTVESGYEKYTASMEKAQAYKESAAAYRRKFELGEITAVDMLQQETNYLSALNDFIQNKYTYLLNRKLIDVYMGVKITL